MTTKVNRPLGCLKPIPINNVIAEPESIREIARDNGPYFMPARYLIGGETAADAKKRTPHIIKSAPSYLIGPTWRGDWAFDGEVLVDEAADLLHHEEFIDATKKMFGSEIVVPEQVFVNLTSPMQAQPFSHVDIPEFVGINRQNAPGWFLQAMGSSRLFEDIRISSATAVAWFYHGERGYFRYWPQGRDTESIRHENMWNSAVVGDNDFMHHLVERVGPKGAGPPEGMTINTELDHGGKCWNVIENEKLKPFIKELKTHLEILSTFTVWIKEKVQNSKDDASAACNDYLKALGFVSIAHAWIKVLEVSFKDYEQNKEFYEDKIQTANFYFKRVLPRAESHFKTATSGSDYIMNFKFS